MNEGLEVWEYIRENYLQLKKEKYSKCEDVNNILERCNKRCDIIQKELKRLYELEKTTLTFSNVQQIMFELEKSKKALEIIKEKQVNFYWLSISSCVGDYNIEVKEYFYKSNFEEFLLTKEEYDSLKEVSL